MITTGSEGETCSRRPRCAPAGVTRKSRVRLAGHHPATLHVLGEGGHRQLLGDLRLAHERPAPVPAHEHAVADEIVEGRSDGQARDTEVDAELPLGRDRVADPELLDQVEHPGTRLGLLGDGSRSGSHRGVIEHPTDFAILVKTSLLMRWPWRPPRRPAIEGRSRRGDRRNGSARGRPRALRSRPAESACADRPAP